MFPELRRWVQENQGFLDDGLEVRACARGRGLFWAGASSGLDPGKCLLSLPLEACLSSADPCVAELPVNSLFRLTELFCRELQKGPDSRWALWFAALPANCGNWPEWPEDKRSEAKAEGVKLLTWQKQLSQILPDSAIAGLRGASGPFRRALAVLLSRRFNITCAGAHVAVCVPFGDMINHAPSCEATVEVQYHEAWRELRFVTTRPVTSMQELFMCYGDFGNSELCANHGFTPSPLRRAEELPASSKADR
ncbi:unnamed protein product [Effrenium voratum]|uniref:SET domain-containing protein n=1 Tax=Effrenium voratum TaxID=2562239 RepID=A0AA36NAR2_9DINO|nr:unnamed protein product [Effrenium voratum]